MSPDLQYDLHGLCLRVQADSFTLPGEVEELLSAFPSRAPAAGAFELTVAAGADDAPVPLDAKLYWRGLLADGWEWEYYTRDVGRRIHLPGRALLEIDFSSRRASLTVQPGQGSCLLHGCLIPLLCEVLGREGQVPVHAASLAWQGPHGPEAMLISGISGRGKTTTCLALSLGGMQLLSDDTTFIIDRERTEGLRLWGLPLPVKVRQPTFALLPELMRLQRRPGLVAETHVLCADDAQTRAAVTARPRAILFLDEYNPHAHQLAKLDKIAAVARLARENVRTTDPTSQGPGGQAFRTLSKLVGSCECYCLSAGPDLRSLPQLITERVLRNAE